MEGKTPVIVVLISGSGSNLQAIIDAAQQEHFDAKIAAVISNKESAFGLERARKADIDARFVDHTAYSCRELFDVQLIKEIDAYNPDLVVLAGFMRILTDDFVKRYEGRLLNIHPSLLPKYPGLHTHQRAIEAGDKEHGVTVHFVTAELDGGPNVIQAKVPVLPNDTAQTLSARVLTQEHVIYPIAVKWFVEGRLCMKENEVLLDGETLPESGLVLDNETTLH